MALNQRSKEVLNLNKLKRKLLNVSVHKIVTRFFFVIKVKIFAVSKKDFKHFGCIVVVILSHGTTNETIYAFDDVFNLTQTVVHPIAQNKTLIGKPKIFIIAACKGRLDELGKTVIVKDAVPFKESPETSVPYMRDILKCYSTYEGMYVFFLI